MIGVTSKEMYEALQQIAEAINRDTQQVAEKWNEAMQAASEAIAPVVEQIGDAFAELPDLPRTPAEIKKDIKYERNPMRLKKLNKELNESYKAYGGRKHG